MSLTFSSASRLQKYRCVTVASLLVPFTQLLSLQASSSGPPPNLAGKQTSHDRQKASDFILGFLMGGDEDWRRGLQTEMSWLLSEVFRWSKKTLEVCLWLVFWEIFGPHCTRLIASVIKVWYCWIESLFCTDTTHWLRFVILLFLLQRNRCQLISVLIITTL